MKYAIVFSLLGCACAFYAVTASPLPLRLFFGSSALCWLGVGLAYAGIGSRIFGKRPDGRLTPWSILFWPFHTLNFALLRTFRRSKKENPFDLITENVLLGCQLNPRDETELSRHNVRSVLDLTCEFAEPPFLRRLNYLSIPLLDTRAPNLEQLQTGLNFLTKQVPNGPVYIHCALGHGRSALFAAAYLLQTGQAPTPETALEQVRQKRPNIALHPAQMALLNSISREEIPIHQ